MFGGLQPCPKKVRVRSKGKASLSQVVALFW